MANVEAPSTVAAAATAPSDAVAPLLISLSPTPREALAATIDLLRQAFPGESAIVVSPDFDAPDSTSAPGLLLLPHGEGAPVRGSWVLTPPEFLSAYKHALAHGASGCLLLGPEAHSLNPAVVRSLAEAVLRGNADLCTPDYSLGPREGLVNSALLYPLSRALYNAQPRFPLAIDMAVSLRLSERLASVAQRYTAANDDEALLWPVAEAAVAGMRIAQVPGEHRQLPAPNTADLNTLLAHIAGSLFADVEAKATFWQRSRPTQPSIAQGGTTAASDEPVEVQPMIDAFRVAYTNLAEIWSLVLPPQSLLGLKRLSSMEPATFRMPAGLWARIIYDFVLAYRLRTLNRGHLLGALTPLYLAWVASHLLYMESGTAPERHIEETVAAFETEKPYFVSRWRWPDRFNP